MNIRVLAAASLAALSLPALAQSTNLIQNGSFEMNAAILRSGCSEERWFASRSRVSSCSATCPAQGNDSKTSERYDVSMPAAKRSTIYFDPAIHRALRLKAAAMDVSISELVNDAVKQTLSEDAADLEVFEKRRREPTLDFEDVVRAMRRSGKL